MAGAALPTEMPPQAPRMLAMSTSAFMVSFAAWTIFSIIGRQIQKEHGRSETQLGLLLASAAFIWLLTYAESLPEILVAALGIGLAGGTFITGITFTSIAPRVMGEQIGAGNPQYAMYGFAVFYALCLVVNWWFYLRRCAEIYNP